MRIDSVNGFKTIPESGLTEKFWRYVERVTGRRSLRDFVWRGTILTLFSMFPTVLGCVVRGRVYRALLGGIDSHCFIEKNVRFNVPSKIFLGKRVYVGEGTLLDSGKLSSKIVIKDDTCVSRFCSLRAGYGEIEIDQHVNIGEGSLVDGNGGIEIGKNSLLGTGVVLLTGNHIYRDPRIPIRFQGTETGKVKVGEDVWLGAHVVVLPGVTVGNGSVVGSGAVVTKDIPPCSLAVGVPAKIIGKRA